MHGFAALVDAVAHVINRYRHEGQGRERVQAKFGVNHEHFHDNEHNEHHEVEGVHHGRSEVHAHLADVFADAVHQIAGIVAAVKGHAQLLVVRVDFVFLIVFNQARHHNDGLPREKEKNALDEVDDNVQHSQ